MFPAAIVRRAAILVVVAFFLASVPAAAVQLMVNGTTPSIRYQRWADHARVPTVNATVNLTIGPCPVSYAEGQAAGCTDIDTRPEHVYIDPAQNADIYRVREALMHELGHVFSTLYMTAADRDHFRRIWHRPALGWWAPLAPASNSPLGCDGSCGVMSSAGEWFADAYRVCALDRVTMSDDTWVYDFGNIPVPEYPDYRMVVNLQRQGTATCRLIRAIARRHGASRTVSASPI